VLRQAATASDGSYGIASLSGGQYKITVRKQGFRTVARLGVNLPQGEARRVDFDLQIGGMQEVITIEGGSSTVNMEDASAGIVVEAELAERLPINGHTLQGLIAFAPGVLATPATLGEAGQFSVNGQRPNANYFVVNGVSGNSGLTGSGLPGQFPGGTLPAMTALGTLHGLASMTEVREVRVQTSTFAPEFGRMPGAQVMVNTLAGSNQFHGQAYYRFRHERISTLDPFLERSGLGRPPLRLHDPSLSVGGPIRGDRTFFFASTEVLRLRQPSVWRLAVPSLSAREGVLRGVLDAFPLPQRQLSALYGESTVDTSWPAQVSTRSIRIDHAISSEGALFLRYHESPSSNRSGFVQRSDSNFRTRSFTAGLTLAISESLLNDSRLNISTTSAETSWSLGSSTESVLQSFSTFLPPQTGAPSFNLYGLSIGGLGQLVHAAPSTSRQRQFQITDTIAITSGRHQIRLGVDYLRLSPSRDKAINAVAASFGSLEDLLTGRAPDIIYAGAPGGSSLIETLSAFAQDTYAVSERFKVTYGLRWEFTPPPAARASPEMFASLFTSIDIPLPPPPLPGPISGGVLPAINQDPSWKLSFGGFAPRIGAAYRLNSNGTFVLRAGMGIFYDLGFASAIDPLNAVPFNSWRTALVSPVSFDSGLSYGFARDLRIPRSLQWNITLERSLSKSNDGTLSVAWVSSLGRNLLRREGYLSPDAHQPKLLVATSHGSSDYQSFQAQYRLRLWHGLQGIVSYTWSHAIDNGSWDSGSYLVTDAGGAARDRGAANFDVRHSAVAGINYDVARNWSVSTIVKGRTGFPIDVLSYENAFGLGFDNAPRPDFVGGVPLWITDGSLPGARRLNPGAFSVPAAGLQGTLGRNAIRGGAAAQVDAAVERRFTLPNRSMLHVRLQAYNLSNTTIFGDPIRVLSSPLFGRSSSLGNLMLGTGRPSSGLTPAFQTGGPRTLEVSLGWKF
jgi:hypothetical protein